MRKQFIDQLVSENFISREQEETINEHIRNKPFSLHWELRVLLYAGILLLSSGIGIFIYENIDSIGHTAIILFIALSCVACFYYVFKNRMPYSNSRVVHTTPWNDYVLLLGCLLFLALEGYLQYQNNFFGTRYGIATLLPAILFFALAYFFDHAGILSMGITALASFAGISVSPGIFAGYEIAENQLIFSGASLAALLIAAGYYFKIKEIKRHFTFTYYNFGFNLFLICMLGAMMTKMYPFAYLGIHVLACALLIRFAIHEHSFYFLLLGVLYAYAGLTWMVFYMELGSLTGLYYFVISCVGVIWFFLNYKKILKLK